ncbi:two-component system chemotaxis response regulator CheB [Variovorax sp. GrIS 2.14]|uniref:chemotaxis protein CheB n=1 Tax=Variovorax sp. GrIS 2.14 TaxID=3071709 RepID=UPI0038F6E958
MANIKPVRDIVLIGASRGGLDALARITSALPPDFPAAVLVVIHTLAGSPGLLDTLVGKKSSLPVAYAEDGEPIKQGRIYLAPPDFHLTVSSAATVSLEHSAKVRHSRPAADVLFESAAAVFRERVIGVVLTGGDHDGTDGMNAIRAAGGIGIVQSPSDSLDPSMPSSAITGAQPQFVVMLDEIPKLLIRLVSPPT